MYKRQELRQAYQGDGRVRQLIDTAKKIEGMPRHASTHAAGVLIPSSPVSYTHLAAASAATSSATIHLRIPNTSTPVSIKSHLLTTWLAPRRFPF